MKSSFVVHASVWDTIAVALVSAFVVVYLVIWAVAAASQSRRKK